MGMAAGTSHSDKTGPERDRFTAQQWGRGLEVNKQHNGEHRVPHVLTSSVIR